MLENQNEKNKQRTMYDLILRVRRERRKRREIRGKMKGEKVREEKR